MTTLTHHALRTTFTNDVIRAIGALARQQHVCREQDGNVAFVTGMEAAREYIVEHVLLAIDSRPSGNARACENYRFGECVDGVNYCVCNWVDIAHTCPAQPAEAP